MCGYDPRLATAAARAILEQGGHCVLEACVDVPSQRWEAQLLIFDRVPEAVAEVIAEEVDAEPGYDLRLTGCDRGTLCPAPAMGAHLCYLAELPTVALEVPVAALRTNSTNSFT